MSIVVHSLESSRSIRVAWLLEELGLPYEIKLYARDENLRAPPELASVHPLGRSPVVEVDGYVLAESGAILEYFVEREDRLRPASTDERIEYRFFLHYAEGSMMPPLLVHLIMRKLRERPLPFFVKPIARKIAEGIQSAFSSPAIALHMGFVERTLEKRPYLAGQSFSAADVQMYFPIATALMRVDGSWPNVVAWKDRVTQRDAFARATEKTGELIAFS